MAKNSLERKIRERNIERFRTYKFITHQRARQERGLSATERRDMYGTSCKLTDEELEQDYG